VTDHVLALPPHVRDLSIRVFAVSLGAFSLNLVFGAFSSLITGFQRMDATNSILMAVTVANAAGTVLVLSRGLGIEGLAWNNAATTALAAVLNVAVARRVFPALSVNPFRHWCREEAGRILSFSWKIQVTSITQIAIFQADRVILSHFVGLGAVSLYEVGNRIASLSRGLVASLILPITPAASAMHAREEGGLILGLYRRSLKYMAAFSVPFFLLVAALAAAFVRTWVGEGYGESALALRALSLAFLVNVLTGPGNFVLNGIGLPGVGMRFSILGAVLNLALCLVLVHPFGFRGVLAGVVLSLGISGMAFLAVVRNHLPGLEGGIYGPALARPLALSLPPALALAVLDAAYPVRGYLPLVGLAGAYTVVVAAGLLRGAYLDDYDRGLIDRILPWRRPPA
jgi:O-antigen/teichoic acid export membrane protein